MNNHKSAPVIPFDAETDSSKTIEFIKHQHRVRTEQGNEDTVEDRIPKLSEDALPFEILQFLSTFQRVRQTLNWTTGPKLFQKFPMHLSGYHLDVWESVATGRNATVIGFNQTLQDFKLELLEGYTYEDQLDYLRTVKKPGKMEPGQFLLKLRAANRMAAQLPNHQQMLKV